MEFKFEGKEVQQLQTSIKKEWSLTNSIGGYAGGSITGALGRTHQGYLIASLHPPVERYLVFAKTDEAIKIGKDTYSFATNRYAGQELSADIQVASQDLPEEYRRTDTVSVASDFVPRQAIYEEGNRFLTSFTYDGTLRFVYEVENCQVTKEVTLINGQNTCAIAYTISNKGAAATLAVTPFLNYRDHNGCSTPKTLVFSEKAVSNGFLFTPSENQAIAIELVASQGKWTARHKKFAEDIQLAVEVELETPGLDSHYTPYDLEVEIPANSIVKFSLMCSVLQEGKLPSYSVSSKDSLLTGYSHLKDETAFTAISNKKKYVASLLEKAQYDDDLAQELTLAADSFLAYRDSTKLTTVLAGLPWFTDWGRDTMIAFSGLVLSTKRFDKARQILETFSTYVHHGMVPNMFPDNGQEPLYNTVDASLWYFYATYQYLRYDKSKEAKDFVGEKILPALLEIQAAYENGTDFSIYMDKDGLIHAGSGVDQVTWMDVRVGNWVVTPRHGKPVEISALWYNALRIMESFADLYPDQISSVQRKHYAELADLVKTSFGQKFWNPDWNCLYDVVDSDEVDTCIRPNQIYAVSLPFSLLEADKEKAIVDTVLDKLYVGVGLRSLAPGHKDYHGIYCGSLPKRDAAYHQGTAWGFLLGGFLSAYMKVYGHTPEVAAKANELLNPVRQHLREGGIGTISEIFDGDEPHNCRGCYGQAWSVGEVLRAYTEDILPYLA